MGKIVSVCLVGITLIMFGVEIEIKRGKFKFKWLGITHMKNFINRLKINSKVLLSKLYK